ncbi:MAG: hypothetical protein C5B51_26405 [Terriglobia bacterium]|nr:MAG: hypothetical protein C5B51_26405 [Terriglobia bacterium]
MKFFRSILFFLPAACLPAQTPPPATPLASPAVPADKVVLSVGDVKLTAAQFDQIVQSLPEQYRSVARGQGRKDFGQNLVRVLLLAEEGKRRKINETSEYKTQADFQSANLLAARTFSQIGDAIKVEDADLHKYYDGHKTEYEQVHARHILIRMTGSPAPADPNKKELTEPEALAKAQEIRKKLVGGADFAALASEESDDSGSKVKGGDLSFFKRGQMVPQFEEAAFALKVGDISEPVKTPFGYHVIQVQGKKGYEEAKPEVERKMKTDLAQKTLEDMEKKASVVLDPAFFGPPVPPPAPPAVK